MNGCGTVPKGFDMAIAKIIITVPPCLPRYLVRVAMQTGCRTRRRNRQHGQSVLQRRIKA
jgi:hypothetical protein